MGTGIPVVPLGIHTKRWDIHLNQAFSITIEDLHRSNSLSLSIMFYLKTVADWVHRFLMVSWRDLKQYDLSPNIICPSLGLLENSAILWPSPLEENRKVLETNLNLNDIKNVEIIPYAAGINTDQTLSIDPERPRPDNSGAKFLVPDTTGTITTIKIDDIIPEADKNKIGFIKIDVKEMELEVLLGAQKILTYTQPNLYIEFIEPNHPNKRKKKMPRYWTF